MGLAGLLAGDVPSTASVALLAPCGPRPCAVLRSRDPLRSTAKDASETERSPSGFLSPMSQGSAGAVPAVHSARRARVQSGAPGKSIRDSEPEDGTGGWSHGHPLPITHSKSRLPKVKQVFSIRKYYLHKQISHHEPCSSSSQMAAKGQPCKQTLLRRAISGLLC